jgi:hypothetical protein
MSEFERFLPLLEKKGFTQTNISATPLAACSGNFVKKYQAEGTNILLTIIMDSMNIGT